jgi:uncharacterized metal-binding protein
MADSCCGGGVKLLYPCSGASDVGELTDRAAIKLWAEGFATRTCLAAIGGDVAGYVLSAKAADINITVDGCSQLCAKKTLERIGVESLSIMLGDHGFAKGESPVTDETIDKAASIIRKQAGTESLQTLIDTAGAGGCGCGRSG